MSNRKKRMFKQQNTSACVGGMGFNLTKILFIFICVIGLNGLVFAQTTSHTVELKYNWEYMFFPYCESDKLALEQIPTHEWRNANVPGEVQVDLRKDGLLPDLNYGQNFYSAVWVENQDFIYRTQFQTPLHSVNGRVYLDFDGLDCFATLWVNGKVIGKTHNMFKTYSFDVTDVLNKDENELMVRLASPMKEVYKQVPSAKEKMDKLSCAFYVKERLITRKVQMSYGWDNVPRIITSGIYRPVKLRVCETARIENVWFRTTLSENYTKAKAKIDVELLSKAGFKGDIEIILTRGNKTFSNVQTVSTNEPNKSIALELIIPNPELWWPAGVGEQPLYHLEVRIKNNKTVSDSYRERVAIREIKVVTTPVEKRMVNYKIANPTSSTDVMDGGFVGAWSKVALKTPEEVEVSPLKFYVNGQFVFIKGWNFQPLDVFVSQVTKERYNRSVEAAKEAGANMLRVWGGGNVESPAFYDACDEKGIMVWQDFFYASGQYPNDDDFLKEAESETVNVVKQLRNRACLAAWCGDNESDMVNNDRGVGQFANKITHVVQKKVMESYDPDRFWHPSSPSGGGYPRSPWGGDKRNWGAGFPENDYQHIRGDEGRFISEGGTSDFSQLSSLRKYLPQEFEWPMNNDYHNMHFGDVPTMRRDFPKSLWGNIDKYFGNPQNLGDYVYLTQIAQAQGLEKMGQHFRMRMGDCGGVLMWKWADTWPSACMSVIDYDEFKKASYYAVKNAFALTTLMMKNQNDSLSIWYLNDLAAKPNQVIKCQLRKYDGSLVREWSNLLTFNKNSSGQALDLKIKRADVGNGDYYFRFSIENSDTPPNYYVPCDLIKLKTNPANVTVSVQRNSPKQVTLIFKATEFTPYILITGNNPYIKFSDNEFYMEKGEEKKVILSIKEGEIWGDFSYRWWKSETHNFLVESELLKPVGNGSVSYP